MNGARNHMLLALALTALALPGCVGLKYAALKGTSVSNPPQEDVRIYIREFPVESKANVLERRAVVGKEEGQPIGNAISDLAEVGSAVMVISRPARIEDLSGAVLRALRHERVQVFADIVRIEDMSLVREVENPFELVEMQSPRAQLEVSGRALIKSQRVSKKFSPNTTNVEVELSVRDLSTGKTVDLDPLRFGIHMRFNSKELEEAMATAVVTYLMQKTLI